MHFVDEGTLTRARARETLFGLAQLAAHDRAARPTLHGVDGCNSMPDERSA
jgi:hypothetical protein